MKIPVDKFRMQCLAAITQMQKTGKPILITEHGKPLAKLVPVDDEIFGYMSGKVKIVGDIVRTTTPVEDWQIK